MALDSEKVISRVEPLPIPWNKPKDHILDRWRTPAWSALEQ